ncbi:unnamed protein product, partial [Citrullus colocynthis]
MTKTDIEEVELASDDVHSPGQICVPRVQVIEQSLRGSSLPAMSIDPPIGRETLWLAAHIRE